MSLTAAFAHFGVKPANPRWSWSAVSEDGGTVVLTLWRDLFDYAAKPPAYVDMTPNYRDWSDHPGNLDRVRHLKHAAVNCDGLFRGIITVAKDPAAHPREIIDCFPWEGVWLRLVNLDEKNGPWSAVVDHRD